jgi:hypothetical protein
MKPAASLRLEDVSRRRKKSPVAPLPEAPIPAEPTPHDPTPEYPGPEEPYEEDLWRAPAAPP